MDVLMLDTHGRSGMAAQRQLEDAGHRVFRCHTPGETSFACTALDDEPTCPFDDDGIDVAVVVRERPSVSPTALEDGVVCTLRHHIPLVVAGESEVHPYRDWAAVTIDGTDDVVSVCEQAAAAPLRRHEEVALRALEAVLTGHELPTEGVAVTVRRQRGAITVELKAPGVPPGLRAMVATRVGVAIRTIDLFTARMSIAVVGD
ncbi:MAG TPA: hypothetical protein VMN58_10850 [Acidimicrobiales bacterium]|nr:hypothetical protein [Acidimicrobiales bacterium]